MASCSVIMGLQLSPYVSMHDDCRAHEAISRDSYDRLFRDATNASSRSGVTFERGERNNVRNGKRECHSIVIASYGTIYAWWPVIDSLGINNHTLVSPLCSLVLFSCMPLASFNYTTTVE